MQVWIARKGFEDGEKGIVKGELKRLWKRKSHSCIKLLWLAQARPTMLCIFHSRPTKVTVVRASVRVYEREVTGVTDYLVPQ